VRPDEWTFLSSNQRRNLGIKENGHPLSASALRKRQGGGSSVAKRARQKVRRTAAQKQAADVADLQAQRESIAAREASLRTQEASAQASPQRQLTAAAATVSDPIIRNEFEKVARALQDGAEAGLAAIGRPSAG
jgi:hypothetical protein